MIEARALVSINFLNLSENYDFMSRWLGAVSYTHLTPADE